MEKTTVRDFMAKNLVTFTEDMDLYAAIEALIKHGISGAPVVDEYSRLVGILSQKDCIRVLANGVFHSRPAGPVKDYMTEVVMTIDPDTDMFTVADLFLNNVYRRIPVVEDEKVVGQVSRRDVLHAIQTLSGK